MKYLTIIFLLTAFILISCNKPAIEKGTPGCVEEIIMNYSKSVYCDNAHVDEYKFQGEIVYTFDPGTCGADMTTEVINSECNSLGYLGGLTGNTGINGEEFSNAIFVKMVWEK
jgi:hypothetical protein